MKVIAACLFALVGIACSPPMVPVSVTVPAPPGAYAGSNCKVRVESFAFAPDLRVGTGSEADFLAKLDAEQKSSFATDKSDSVERFFETIEVNEEDYVGDKGSVVRAASGDHPLAVRAKVTSFDPEEGIMTCLFEVIQTSDDKRVAEFSSEVEGIGYGSGMEMRVAATMQALAVLSYFREQFACVAASG